MTQKPRWSDERIYCSELVWKFYKQGAGIEVGKAADRPRAEPTGQSPLCKTHQTALRRHRSHFRLDEPIISPQAIFEIGPLGDGRGKVTGPRRLAGPVNSRDSSCVGVGWRYAPRPRNEPANDDTDGLKACGRQRPRRGPALSPGAGDF